MTHEPGRVDESLVVRRPKRRRWWWILLALVVLAGVVWRMQLLGLPSVGEPFDVASFMKVDVEESRNAFIEYSLATAKMKVVDVQLKSKKVVYPRSKPEESWGKLAQGWKDTLAESGEALAIWRSGTDKPDAIYHRPSEDLSFRTLLPITQELRRLGHLGVVEGLRLEDSGDLAGAWGWYRATFRSSRHSGRHGFPIERMVGSSIHQDVAKVMTRWASNPKVDAAMLRRALDDVLEADAMTSPVSDHLKVEYLVFERNLNSPNMVEDLLVERLVDNETPDWFQDLSIPPRYKQPIQTVRVALSDDRERSLRLARLLTANWLAEVDKPPSQRAKILRAEPLIFEANPTPGQSVSAESLSSWVDTSMLAIRWSKALRRWIPDAIDKERIRQSRLVVHLASELYRREHGKPPASPQDLVGPYLKALPEGHDQPEP